jgi:hypothetical protein
MGQAPVLPVGDPVDPGRTLSGRPVVTPALALRQPLKLAEAALERSLALGLQALSLSSLLAHSGGLNPLGTLLADPQGLTLLSNAFSALDALLTNPLILATLVPGALRALGLGTLILGTLVLGTLRLSSLGALGPLRLSSLGALSPLGSLRLGSLGVLGPLPAALGSSAATAIRLDLSRLAFLAAAPIAGLCSGWSRNRHRGNASRENQLVHVSNSVV